METQLAVYAVGVFGAAAAVGFALAVRYYALWRAAEARVEAAALEAASYRDLCHEQHRQLNRILGRYEVSVGGLAEIDADTE